MDLHLLHFGKTNKSEINRPPLCIIYQRRWSRDTQNFNKGQIRLLIASGTITSLPKADCRRVDRYTWMP